MIEITPLLESENKSPLYIQLSNYIKEEISSGRIKPGEKLPSKRKLAEHLGLSINTIQTAYEQLIAEGFVESILRKGLYIKVLEDELTHKLLEAEKRPLTRCEKSVNVEIDFNSGKVDVENFPYSLWKKTTVQSLYEDQGELFNMGNPQGELQLREEIAKYTYMSRGVKCTPEQIVIGAGTQVLMTLLSILIGDNMVYALENPGFHRTRKVLQDLGRATTLIPLDTDGINIEQLKHSGANVVYVTPSHQFPVGIIMPIKRRLELLEWAESIHGYVIEDDYDGEYRYEGKPIPSLQGLDILGKVVYMGTFSKSLIPSIRISYMVLPPILIERYKENLLLYKQTVSRLHQDTLYRFMKEGYWQSHLNKMRTLYRKKHSFFMQTIKKHLHNQVRVIGENSGLHLILQVNNNWTEKELIDTALQEGVKVYPLSVYYENGSNVNSSVLLGFGGLSEKQIDIGIQLLKKAWQID
ncbi:PLP-dependent aminotransferase family protein [Paenibacillus alvei]